MRDFHYFIVKTGHVYALCWTAPDLNMGDQPTLALIMTKIEEMNATLNDVKADVQTCKSKITTCNQNFDSVIPRLECLERFASSIQKLRHLYCIVLMQ